MEKHNKTLYLDKRLVTEHQTDELWSQLLEDTHAHIHTFQENFGYADAEVIAIDKLIEHLQAEKAKGATHVEIEYHCDHRYYLIDSYTIGLASQEKIDEFRAKNRENKISAKKIELKRLENQIEQIKKELENE